MSSFADFELTINPKDAEHTFVVHGRTAKGMQDSDTLILPLEDPRYQAFQTALDYNTPLTEDQVIDFGIVLYETLLKGKIWALFTAARDAARSQGQSLRIKLNIDASNPALGPVATIPWEFACDNAGIPLATDHSICRFLAFPESLPALKFGPGKITHRFSWGFACRNGQQPSGRYSRRVGGNSSFIRAIGNAKSDRNY